MVAGVPDITWRQEDIQRKDSNPGLPDIKVCVLTICGATTLHLLGWSPETRSYPLFRTSEGTALFLHFLWHMSLEVCREDKIASWHLWKQPRFKSWFHQLQACYLLCGKTPANNSCLIRVLTLLLPSRGGPYFSSPWISLVLWLGLTNCEINEPKKISVSPRWFASSQQMSWEPLAQIQILTYPVVLNIAQ